MSSQEVVRDCPFCGKLQHLWVNRRRRLFHCFVCKAGGHVRDLPWDEQYVLGGENGVKECEPLPAECPRYATKVDRYLRERLEVGEDECLPSVLRTVYASARGIVFDFPDWLSGDEEYWQERRWSGKPRWKNSIAPWGPAQGVLYPAIGCGAAEVVCIVEGVFDALKVGVAGWNAAATLSSKVHPAQVRRLVGGYGYRHAIYLPDNDGTVSERTQAETILRLSEGGFETVKRAVLPAPDPAEMPLADLRRALEEAMR